jgi:hypothetical protein
MSYSRTLTPLAVILAGLFFSKVFLTYADVIGMSKLHTVCAWCQTVLVKGDKSKGISHGICQSCADKVREDLKREASKGNCKQVICK